MEAWLTPRNTPLPTCYPAEFVCSGSCGKISTIGLKHLTIPVLLLKVTQGHRTHTDQSATYDFLFVIHSNQGRI